MSNDIARDSTTVALTILISDKNRIIDTLQAKIDALQAKIDAMRAIHVEIIVREFGETISKCDECGLEWPCRTVRVIDGVEETK